MSIAQLNKFEQYNNETFNVKFRELQSVLLKEIQHIISKLKIRISTDELVANIIKEATRN